MILRSLFSVVLVLLPLHAEPAVPAPVRQAETATSEDHPFLDNSGPPRWSKMTPEQLRIDSEIALQAAMDKLRVIEQVTEPTYDNTFGKLANDMTMVNTVMRTSLLSSTCDSPEWRTATQELLARFSTFDTAFWQNETIWKIMQQAAASEWAKTLPPHRRYFIQKVIQRFRMEGIDLPPARRTRLSAIKQELTDLAQQFSANLIDSRREWQFDLTPYADLGGIETLHFEQEGNRRIARLDQAFVMLSFADDEKLREAVWTAMKTLGKTPHDNGPVIQRILALRHEQARILGYASYADLVATRCMMGTSEAAERHIRSMLHHLTPQHETALENLRMAKAEHTHNPAAILQPWDTGYYTIRLARDEAPFNGYEFSRHLPTRHVFPRIFAIFSELYGISITECPAAFAEPGSKPAILPGTAEVWAPGVRYYEVRDKTTGTHLGSFYIDGDPKPGKKPGTWTQTISIGKPASPQSPRIPHYAAITTSLPSTGTLSCTAIATYFHEFGHILHQMQEEVECPSLGNYALEPDFREFPSILHEKLAREPEILARISQPAIPAELLAALATNHRFFQAYNAIVPYHQALIDLELHRHYEQYAGKDIDTVEQEIIRKNSLPSTAFNSCPLRTNLHIFANFYAGVYYTYAWNDILAEDAFSRFREKGLTNPETGDEFRRTILSQGSSKPAAELYRNFMGRDPKPDALLHSLDIKPQKEIPSDAKTR